MAPRSMNGMSQAGVAEFVQTSTERAHLSDTCIISSCRASCFLIVLKSPRRSASGDLTMKAMARCILAHSRRPWRSRPARQVRIMHCGSSRERTLVQYYVRNCSLVELLVGYHPWPDTLDD
eukprot:scaffold203680_cov43-Tisochrysis_lutea.AAC.2